MNARRIVALLLKETRELVRDPVTLALAVVMPLVMVLVYNLELKEKVHTSLQEVQRMVSLSYKLLNQLYLKWLLLILDLES